MKVLKKNGTYEPLDISKISKSIEWACSGLDKVSTIDIEANIQIHFYDGIKTSAIDKIVMDTIKDMADLRRPNYDFVYARLMSLNIRKEAFGISKNEDFKHIKLIIKDLIDRGYYVDDILNSFTDEDLDKFNEVIDHNRDFTFTGAGIEYLKKKYTIHNKDGRVIESPNVIFAAIALVLHPGKIDECIEFYDDLSTFKISLPSPAMNHIRTNEFILASCTKITVGDNIDSWNEASKAVVNHTAASSGVGLDYSLVASIGDMVKNGKIKHSGKVPLLKKLEADVNASQQNGRRGTGTAFIAFFDPEIETILNIASPRTEANKRIVNLSYGIKVNQLLYDRAAKNEDITLFSSRDSLVLYELFTSKNYEEFVLVYEALEARGVSNKKINAKYLLEQLPEVRQEIGKHYIVHIDEMNNNTPFDEDIIQSQACVEIALPTKPVQSFLPNDPSIAICILSNVNMGKVSLEELPSVTKSLVYMLNNNVRKQNHPMSQSNAFVEQYMALGIGVSNTAYFLAKQGIRYTSPKALEVIDEYMEHFTYYLIKASMEYAKEYDFVPKKFGLTSYSRGVMPYERRNKNVDKLLEHKTTLDWYWLKNQVLKYGMANTCLTSIPPSETSAVIGGQTNSIYPIRDLVYTKSSSNIVTKFFAPECAKLAGNYDFVYDREEVNTGYLKVAAIMQKWIDQSISLDVFYNPELYQDNKVPMTKLISDLYFCKKYGIKSIYYHNVYSPNEDDNKLVCTDCEV